MASAAQVVKASLQRILVQASEAPLEPSEFQDAIFAMNNLMFQLDAQGVQLGYTEVKDLGDEVTVPIGALRGLIAMLAVEISSDYDGEVTPGLANAEKEGKATMFTLGVGTGETRFSSTLPIGSGNDWDRSQSSYFYPDSEASILAETTGAISLELETNNVAEGGTP